MVVMASRVTNRVIAKDGVYRRWRDARLACCAAAAEDLIVEIRDPGLLTAAERRALLERISRSNMVIYTCVDAAKATAGSVADLATQLGLRSPVDDASGHSVTELQAGLGSRSNDYIPYTRRPLNWHTDGYYNVREESIGAFLLHCVRPAASGGANAFVDPEIIYLLLRDENPEFIEALAQDDVMTVPANVRDGVVLRPRRCGPVFSANAANPALRMRYTARPKFIEWKQHPVVKAAVQKIEATLGGDSPYILSHRLEAGQGVICNNVLHRRTAFEDYPGNERNRLLYRVRYFDSVATVQGIPAPWSSGYVVA